MNKQAENSGLRTWIEIDTKALEHNYKTLRGLISPETKFMAVVKSNAYGHSLLDFSQEIERLGADWLGVDSIVEATALRKAGIKLPILVLGHTLPNKIAEAAAENISLTVSTFETLERIAALAGAGELGKSATPGSGAKKLAIHIKIDTGMHRQGFMAADRERLLSILKSLPIDAVTVEGLFTHLAAAKNPAFPSRTLAQLEDFDLWQKAFAEAGFAPVIHAAASSGTIVFPTSHCGLVRFGAAMYGIWPSIQVKAFAEKKFSLKSVLSWKTVIGEVKNVPLGESVGYDFTETLARDSKLAVCPIGYWHGLPRALSSIGNVLVNGHRARIIGRVSMDMITIDVTDVPNAKVGDEVTIIGRSGSGKDALEITAKDIADLAETSDYEIITRINPLIKRFLV